MKNVIVTIVILTLIIIACVIEYCHDKKKGQTLMDTTDYMWVAAGFIAFILAMLIAVQHVYAHDHNRADLDDWYPTLQSRGGRLCCDGPGKDAAHLEADQWQTQNKCTTPYGAPGTCGAYSHYRVFLDDKEWHDVPDNAVVDGPNKDGRALVWLYRGYTGMNIACFMPGTMS